MAPTIQIGDEGTLRGLKDNPVAVVTYNTVDDFCAINKEGITYHASRMALLPIKTGRHFDVEGFLRSLNI